MMLYKAIELPSEEPVLYVGVYVLRWGKEDEPTVAFRKATLEEIIEEFNRIRGDQLKDDQYNEDIESKFHPIPTSNFCMKEDLHGHNQR